MADPNIVAALNIESVLAAWGAVWNSDGFNVLVGAFLGALLGWGFDRRQRNQEQTRKQSMLIENLKREISLLGQDTAPADSRVMNVRLPTRLNVIPRLLDGELLEEKEYRNLVDRLIVLEQLVGRYNDWVVMTNEAQIGGSRTRTEIDQMQQRASHIRSSIRAVRNDVAELLGVSEQELQEIRRQLESSATAPQ